MMMIFSMTIILLTLSLIVMTIATILSKKTFSDREKSSPFECGFDPSSSARLPFSLQFFLIAVIFLIFDVEITLLFPLIFTIKMVKITNYLAISLFFLSILLAGLFHEWNQGALNWAK
uniref:NADH dehydrogenase subunit 3 n=1 Tax=Chalcophora japonica TaxID=2818490 RepID=UPI0020011B8F|nr:NADH dehydrogenase subunit 3 [Chalcophora japonica]UNQ87650.1 NADH dehydrogenase subunit 3 [Chalcophora japonica]UVV34752.1 NADH dehydrogenase subunit 3 [Chalcophora japonica]WCO87672.1 NADH dehydrogenase subunit 3 [Chalcophora japonica]